MFNVYFIFFFKAAPSPRQMKFVQNWENIVIEIRIHGKQNLSSQRLNFQIAI
jgi:hypothetical protein